MIDCSSDRMRSGLASARASPSRPAGSTMLAAVIVMTPFEGAVRGSLEGSRDGRVHVDVHAGEDLGYRATPLCGTQLHPSRWARPGAPVVTISEEFATRTVGDREGV